MALSGADNLIFDADLDYVADDDKKHRRKSAQDE